MTLKVKRIGFGHWVWDLYGDNDRLVRAGDALSLRGAIKKARQRIPVTVEIK